MHVPNVCELICVSMKSQIPHIVSENKSFGCKRLHKQIKLNFSFDFQPWRRSYDDGDITPTNEIALSNCDQQGGTLPRHHRSNVPRQQRASGINSFGGLTAQQQQTMMLAGDYVNENSMMCPTKVSGNDFQISNSHLTSAQFFV